MTRLWARGKPLQVQMKGDAPTAIQWEAIWHTIQHIALVWQVDVNWWRVRIHRDYYKVLTEQGVLLVMYHDVITDTWALQRIYD